MNQVKIEDLITQKEAAEMRNVSVSAVCNWIERKHITGYPLFGKTLVSREEVMNYKSRVGRPPRKRTMEVNP